MAGRLLLLVLLGVGCRDTSSEERACLANDPKVKPSFCYRRARAEAYAHGLERGYERGYDDGYAQCEDDHDTGDAGDTGDTGDSGDTGATAR